MPAEGKWTEGQVANCIQIVCNDLLVMLLAKNKAYGNSALDPVRIFSKSDTLEQINVRLDDKLSRLMRGQAAGEDVEHDLMGYLVLKRVHRLLQDFDQGGPIPPVENNPPPQGNAPYKPAIGNAAPGATRPASKEIKPPLQ